MSESRRLPKEGERVRVWTLATDNRMAWVWADVTEVEGDGFYCEAEGGLRLWRDVTIADLWRFPEDDPEVCMERPAFKDGDK